jgi:hypothetical protein
LSSEFNVFILGALYAAMRAATIWALYLAFEPYVRRRWPQSMITWSRVLSGEFRDPLVGGHLLIGVALVPISSDLDQIWQDFQRAVTADSWGMT